MRPTPTSYHLRSHLRLWSVSLLLTCLLALPLLGQGSRRIREHEVQREETLYSIARRYGVPLEKLYELNPWARQQIKVGDKLLIPSVTSPTPSPSSAPKERRHRVEAGETLYSISRKYGLDLVELLRANPGVTSSNIQVGQEIIIPAPSASSEQPASKPEDVRQSLPTSDPLPTLSESTAQTRILLLLPLDKRQKQYIEFFEGFLLGMYELKKQGISIQLSTLDTPNDETLQNYIEQGRLQGKDLVIGGVSEGQLRAIAAASGYGSYIIPFGKINSLETSEGRVILVNAPSSLIIERVVPTFLRKYTREEVVFVRRTSDQEDHLATSLRTALEQAGRSYRTVDLDRGRLTLSPNSVVVPISPDRSLLQTTLQALAGQPSGISLFGYPQWQSYGTQLQQTLHRYGATIYSTFYFDPMQSESKDFLSEFNRWFSHKITNSYPKYSVLGYDLARYFIRAHSLFGRSYLSNMAALPSDGLQLDFYLQPTGEGNLYVNNRFYLITYKPSGEVAREAH